MKKFFYGILKTLWTATIVLVCLFAFDYFYTRKKIEDGYSPYVQTYTASNISIENVDFAYSTDKKSVTIRFVSKSDIYGLMVKVVMKGSNDYLLDSQIIRVGDVLEGQQCVVTAMLPNNDITRNQIIRNCEFSVYDGTIAKNYGPGLYYNG